MELKDAKGNDPFSQGYYLHQDNPMSAIKISQEGTKWDYVDKNRVSDSLTPELFSNYIPLTDADRNTLADEHRKFADFLATGPAPRTSSREVLSKLDELDTWLLDPGHPAAGGPPTKPLVLDAGSGGDGARMHGP